MELRMHCIAIKNINEHIADKQTQRDELIEAARDEHNLDCQEFERVYNKFA